MKVIVSRMNVEVYIKAGCSLCDEAIDDLKRAGLAFVERDIAERPDWFAQWRSLVPVLVINGSPVLTLRWNPEERARVFKCMSEAYVEPTEPEVSAK